MAHRDSPGFTDLEKLNRWRRYQVTLSFILCAAIKKICPQARVRIEHSISNGLYFMVDENITYSGLRSLDTAMKEIIDQGHQIQKKSYPKNKARALFARNGLKDKVHLIENTRRQSIPVYSLLGMHDTFAVPPFDSTSSVPLFGIERFPPGYILLLPTWHDLSVLPGYSPQPKLARIFNEYENWAHILGIDTVGELNQSIERGKGPEIVKVSEALHEKKIVYIADRIVRERDRLVLIAGPSSAGKTTFTKRLSIQLLVNGIRPLIISSDDYFLPHSQTPRDAAGQMDFESIHAVDIPLLNEHLWRIIEGEKVAVPRFNFHTGRRNKGSTVTLPNDGVVLLEGIHCLNETLTHKIPKSIKFKIYVSALTQLNIDDHNRISTTDTRMLRRIIRDTQFRGYNIVGVLERWSRVRCGEERNIYPFQEESDEMFNSALIYEPSIMRMSGIPLLKRVRKKHPAYEEAKRLCDFLDLFADIDERDIPSNSILREFIGGSSFVY